MAVSSNRTDNESATLQTSPGVIRGYHRHAWIDANPQ